MPKFVLPALLFVLAAASPTGAKGDNSRFQLIERDQKTIRLDTKTGEVSFCQIINNGLVCKLAADEREVWKAENVDLTARLEVLEKRIAKLETSNGESSAAPEIDESENNTDEKPLLSEADREKLDTALERVNHVFRSVVGMIKDLSEDFQNR